MLVVALGILAAAFVLIVCDYLRKNRRVTAETARKIPHIVSGCMFAYWPWYLSWQWIGILAVGYLMAALIARQFGFFGSVRYVNRTSWGEYFYPLAVIALSLIQPDKAVFAVAILHVGIADALAAIVGRKYGESFISYKVFGQLKTVLGSLVFLLFSAALVALLVINGGDYENTRVAVLILVPTIATLLENCGVYGSDNFLVPVGVAIMLQLAESIT